jgi:polysaccharide biosynthesis protein PslH
VSPPVVFLSPVLPAETGNGLAMRAGLTLRALSLSFTVHLIVVPLFGPTTSIPDFVRRHAASLAVELPMTDPLDATSAPNDPARQAARQIAWPTPLLCRFAEADLLRRLAARIADAAPALIHVMRLYMAPYAGPALTASGTPAVLDLDDDEVQTRERLAALHRRQGDAFAAYLETREAERFRALEALWAPRFARLLVASEADRHRLAARLAGDRLALYPNAVRVPHSSPPPTSRTLLFVGSLGYPPNEDAALTLIEQILPRLRSVAGEDVTLRIVGARMGERLRKAAVTPGVELAGPVDNISDEYARACLVPIPLRAGGGTRIKLLEALAHNRAVVATTIAAEGLTLEHDRHLLIADEPDEFADACLSLLRDPARANRLAVAGRDHVRQHYELRCIAANLAEGHTMLYDRLTGTTDA